MATIKDVAKLAGVAVSTASYALNGSNKVSEETRKKVVDAARKLEYRPNGIARDLKLSRTNTIGLMLSDLSGPFYSELIKGVQDVTVTHGYDLIAVSSIGGRGSTAAKFLREKRADGVIILAHNIENSIILSAARKDMPVVVLDRNLTADHVINILVDNEGGAYKAVSYLLSLGYRKVFYIAGPKASSDNMKRFQGYKKALEDHGIEFLPNWLYQGDFTRTSGYYAAKSMIMQSNLPDAIFAANDEMAIGVIDAFKEASIRVGEDIGLVGFDDIQLAEYISPPLTTVRQPMREMGTLAAQQIFHSIDGIFPKECIFLDTQLIIRESCGWRKRKLSETK